METNSNNPYASIAAKEGSPFVIRYGRDGGISGVLFNQSWNAAFMMERRHPEYHSRDWRYHLRGETGVEIVGEDRMCSLLASDLAEYWRAYHPELVESLLPRLTDWVLHSSVRMLRGRIRKD